MSKNLLLQPPKDQLHLSSYSELHLNGNLSKDLVAHMLAGDFPGFAPHIVLPEFCETRAYTVFASDDVAVFARPNTFTDHSTAYPPLPLMYYHIVPGTVMKEMLKSPSV